MALFIRELQTATVASIRSNVLMILGDLCIRYTSLVDLYLPTMGGCMMDTSPLVRRHAIMLMSQLILQDYVKWRGVLLQYFLHPLIDSNVTIRELAEYILSGPMLVKSPSLLTNHFVDTVFSLNACSVRGVHGVLEKDAASKLAISNTENRRTIYRFLLKYQKEEQKLQVSAKLVSEVLEDVVEGKLDVVSWLSVVEDTLWILQCKEIKLSAPKDSEVEDMELEPVEAQVAVHLAHAKGKLLSKLSKKNFIENVVPILIALKALLESKKSPALRLLMSYLQDLFRTEQDTVQEILAADPRMAQEVEYDLKKYEENRVAVEVAEKLKEGPNTTRRMSMTPMGKRRPKSAMKTPTGRSTLDTSQLVNSAPRLRPDSTAR